MYGSPKTRRVEVAALLGCAVATRLVARAPRPELAIKTEFVLRFPEFKELVELHGGAISVNSRGRGAGAPFSVLFPCIEATVPLEMPEEKVPSLAGVSVLAVDDNADALDVLKAILGGFRLLEQIRELDREAGRVTPAIAVTAHASEEQIARSAQAGFQNHVANPFSGDQLVRAIDAARMRV